MKRAVASCFMSKSSVYGKKHNHTNSEREICFMRALLESHEVVDRLEYLGKTADGIIGQNRLRRCIALIGGDENGFHPNLLGTEDVVVYVVAEKERLLRLYLQRIQSHLKEPRVRLAISKVTRDDNRVEVTQQPHRAQFGNGIGTLGVRNDCQVIL